MGVTRVYYKAALQLLAYELNYMTNKNKALQMKNEASEEILKNEIDQWKSTLIEMEFYYRAGQVSEFILREADKEDNLDEFNACLGGLYEFRIFLGLPIDG